MGVFTGVPRKRRMEGFEAYGEEFGLLGLSCVGLADWWARSSFTARLFRFWEASERGDWPWLFGRLGLTSSRPNSSFTTP